MHETQEPSTTAPEADLFVAVNDTVTVKASFLAHKPGGPSGEGCRTSEFHSNPAVFPVYGFAVIWPLTSIVL
jgi:hypothetical protein